MAERNNFLIGYGERLASDLAAPLGGAPKKHPYTFGGSPAGASHRRSRRR